MLLDMIQKRQLVAGELTKMLRNRDLLEECCSKLTVSPYVASAIGIHEGYVRIKRG